jgi:4-hydroxy-tetrahydrodipicolinate synthase
MQGVQVGDVRLPMVALNDDEKSALQKVLPAKSLV